MEREDVAFDMSFNEVMVITSYETFLLKSINNPLGYRLNSSE